MFWPEAPFYYEPIFILMQVIRSSGVSQSAKIKHWFSSCISLNVAYGTFLQNLCQFVNR